jgi:lantibiotic modifying enzyme
MRKTEWTAILSGPGADAAWDAIREIAGALRSRELSYPMGSGTGFACGAAGVALFFHALALERPGGGFESEVARFIEIASSSDDPRPVLFNGVPGVAWAIDRIAGPWDGEPDANDDLDATIGAALESWPRAELDLVAGVVGLGVYSLGRLPRALAHRNVARVVRVLAEAGERDDDGVTWRAQPSPTGDDPGGGAGAGSEVIVDLGMAHGVAGIVAFLAQAYAAGVEPRETRGLLEDAVRWLRARRTSPFGYSDAIRASERPGPARSAWCYGNPGVASALIVAARATGTESWLREGVELIAQDAARSARECGVFDTSICHGSIGLAHLCNRAFQASRDRRLAELAQRWANFALEEQRRPGHGLAGFGFLADPADARCDPSLLTGAAGVGAALLALVGASKPSWDGALLLDLPSVTR